MSFHGFSPETAPPRTYRAGAGPMPTLAQTQAIEGKWVWAYCDGRLPGGDVCGHKAPLAVAPFVIRWGPDVPNDVLRQNLRCSKCGRRGATIQRPSWSARTDSWQVFPVEGA
ncbi:hypothetical protein BH10PSE7_BH10PSE7_15680 [soil metagenome]